VVRPLLPTLAALCLLASCGGDGGSAPVQPAGNPPNATELSARELLDATEAIDKLLAAERTREALIVARKLVERAPAGSDSALRANEMAARTAFTHARMPSNELSSGERSTLLAEAAAFAVKSIGPTERDDARISFAALLAAGGGLHGDAARLFDQALAVAPRNPGYLLQAALSALRNEDLARARTYLAQRREAAPGDAWNEALDAEILLAAGDTRAAVDSAQRAVAADRDGLEFRMILGRALRKDGRARDAARMLSALESDARTKPAIAEQLALALAESADFAAAARAWSDCVAANPSDPYVRAEAALAFRAAGDHARAAAELEKLRLLKGGAAEYRRIEPKWTESSPSPSDGSRGSPQ
jgi:thioredoxin-like negative regulator of GroEL